MTIAGHFPPLSLRHLGEFQEMLRESAESGLTWEHALARLNSTNQNLLMGQCEAIVWQARTGQAWGCLRVLTEEGWAWLDAEGEAWSSEERAVVQARLRLGQEPVLRSAGNRWGKVMEALGWAPTAFRSDAFGIQSGIGLYFRRTCPLSQWNEAAVVEALWQYSCHPYIGQGIAKDLREHEERYATVMPALARELPNIQENFEALGVSVHLTWPMPSRGSRDVPAEHQNVPPPVRPAVQRPKL